MLAALIVRSAWRLRSPESLTCSHARAVARQFAAPRADTEQDAKTMNERVADVSWSGFRASFDVQLEAWADAEDSLLSVVWARAKSLAVVGGGRSRQSEGQGGSSSEQVGQGVCACYVGS